jgi:hypothetical protein
MKHHKWRETIQEKILFLNALQLQEHRKRESAPPAPPTCSAPRAASFYQPPSHNYGVSAGNLHDGQVLPRQRSMDGWWIMQLQLGLGNHHHLYSADAKPAFDLHAIKLVHNEFHELITLPAAI